MYSLHFGNGIPVQGVPARVGNLFDSEGWAIASANLSSNPSRLMDLTYVGIVQSFACNFHRPATKTGTKTTHYMSRYNIKQEKQAQNIANDTMPYSLFSDNKLGK